MNIDWFDGWNETSKKAPEFEDVYLCGSIIDEEDKELGFRHRHLECYTAAYLYDIKGNGAFYVYDDDFGITEKHPDYWKVLDSDIDSRAVFDKDKNALREKERKESDNDKPENKRDVNSTVGVTTCKMCWKRNLEDCPVYFHTPDNFYCAAGASSRK